MMKKNVLFIILVFMIVVLFGYACSESQNYDSEEKQYGSLEEIPEFIDGSALTDSASIFGSWHSTGLLIKNVAFDMPNYCYFYNLTIKPDGTACVSRNNGKIENGTWKHIYARILIDFEDSGEYVFWITENKLVMQDSVIGIVFTNDNDSDPIIPDLLEATDDRQFNGEWKINRVFAPDCKLSPATLYYSGVDDTFCVCITDKTVELSTSKENPMSAQYKKTFLDGGLNISNSDFGLSNKLMLTDTGELLFPLFVSSEYLYICLVNDSADSGIITEMPESSDEPQIYYISGKDISVIIPPEISCVTLEADSSDSFYHTGYGDYDTIHSLMEYNNIYLFGLTEDHNCEFYIKVFDFNDEAFNTASTSQLNKYRRQLRNSLGFTATEIRDDIYEGKRDKAIKYHYICKPLSGDDQYVVAYYFTHDNRMFLMQFLSYGNEITENQEKMLQEILDSIEWNYQ